MKRPDWPAEEQAIIPELTTDDILTTDLRGDARSSYAAPALPPAPPLASPPVLPLEFFEKITSWCRRRLRAGCSRR